jgi:hypothetical protein
MGINSGAWKWIFFALMLYGLDALVTWDLDFLFRWGRLSLILPGGFDFSAFSIFFLLPLAANRFKFPFRYYLPPGMGRREVLGVVAGVLLAAIVIFLSFHSDSVRKFYSGLSGARGKTGSGWGRFGFQLVWVLSWLPGYEFLHRHVLLKRFAPLAGGRGWLLVPALEFIFHLQKPLLEAAGAAAFGLIATWWTKKTDNGGVAFLMHFWIELVFLVFTSFVLFQGPG